MTEKIDTSVGFTPYEISLCLYDVPRTRMWKEAIEDVVEPGDVVVDAGSGTGILSVFAAKAGAEKVYAVEIHPRFVTLIDHIAERNNFGDVITTIDADASKVDIPEEVDVIVAELLCTGQFFEPEVQVVNHLRQFLRDDGRVIPSRVRSYIRLVDGQESLYGVLVDTDSRSIVLDDDEPVSTKVCYDRLDFSEQNPSIVDTTVSVKARKSRRADAVMIEGEADLTERIETYPTKFLYNPEICFLDEPVQLECDEEYAVDITYPYGGDTLDAEISVRRI